MVSNLYPPYVHGGAELYVHHISQGLSREHDVSIITTTPFQGNGSVVGKRQLEGKSVIYRFYPLNLYSNFHYSRRPLFIKPFWHVMDVWNPHVYLMVKKALKRERPEIVHVHNFKGLSASVFSAAKCLGIPVVYTAHDYNLICPKTTMLTKTNSQCVNPHALCLLYRRFSQHIDLDAVLAPSDFALNVLSSLGLFTNVPKIKLPLGIVGGDPVKKVDNDTFDILYVGRLGEHKGVQFLLESVRNLDLEHTRLHVVGQGSDMTRFQRAARDDDRIIFHGFLARNILRQLYSVSDVAVVPSIYNETFGLVIPEYYRHGIPVLGSRAGAIPELVIDGYNGLLFQPGNVEQLTACLKRISQDSELLYKLSNNAYKSSATFDMGIHLQKLEEVYKEVALP